MNTVGKTAEHVSGQLNDQGFKLEYTRWTRSKQVEYMNEALKEIGAHRPDAFSAVRNISLVAGGKQNVGSPATLKDIHNSDGSTTHEADAELAKSFAAYDYCNTPVVFDAAGNAVYKVKSFAVSGSDPKTFYVSPAVPNGLSPTVSATLIGLAPEYTLQDWDKPIGMEDKYYNSLIDFMMARAYELDSESAQSRSNSITHMTRFYQSMGVKYKVDSAVRSGFYKGQVGSGDPHARIS